MPKTDSATTKELANLDCLRAFAVLSVLICHLGRMLCSLEGLTRNQELWWGTLGRIGVLAFFVHTCLVLMFSIERLARSPKRVTLRFYIRRTFRIYPLSILCVVGTILLRIPDRAIFNLVFQQPSKGLILANLLLVQNLVGHYSISGPLWSLPYEVQMYVVLPLCYFAFRCKPRGLMYLGCTWIAFACIGVAIKLTTGHANMAGFVPCFLSGVVAYLLAGRVRPFLSAAAWPLFVTFWVGGLTILMAVYVPIEMELGWIGCLVLGISIYAFRDSRIAAWNKVTHNVAKYSYGIYLGHSAALWLVFSYWRIGNPVVGTALWLTLTGIIATGSYHLLEEPLIEVGRRLSSRLERSRESEALSNPERVAVQS